MKDFLESKWSGEQFPRDVIKKSFESKIIEDWHIWLEMLENRNRLSHIYDEKQSDAIYESIKNKYWKPFDEMNFYFENQN